MTSRLTYASVVLILLLTPLLAVARPQPAAAAGVVNQCTAVALQAALAGGGLVTFSCSGVIPLTSRLEIAQDTTIDGGGLVTLDGQGVTQLVHVAAGAALTLRGLTLTNGFTDANVGGAILNDGSLTISSSSLTANAALGGASGGAIYNNGGEVAISHSTLDGNFAAGFGGAILNTANGTVTIIASTLSGNSANAGGAIYNPGAVTMTASTLSGNSAAVGGTIFSFGSAALTASILSGSGLCEGIITSNGYNVASDASCTLLIQTGDVQNVDPMLGNLANNGGLTETHMPLTGSPALDRVPNAICVTQAAASDGQDQRGAPRPESAGLPCDSGAVEVQVNSFFCVGERSGSLRYVSVPNGCVRGELRLLPTVEGVYAFCVGDRSGSMRYLFNAGANCLRGETKLLLPRVEPITICVGERSRSVRYVATAGQCNQRGELPYVVINPAG